MLSLTTNSTVRTGLIFDTSSQFIRSINVKVLVSLTDKQNLLYVRHFFRDKLKDLIGLTVFHMGSFG